jgi:uncharacterized protein involved in exopolysaccharide biosynthesis
MSIENNQITPILDDEISLKDLILLVKGYVLEIWSKKWWVAASIFLFTAFFYYKYTQEKVQYTGELSVLLNNTSSSSMLSGLMGSLGGLGMGEDMTALDKVIVVMKSQEVLGKALLGQTSLPAKNGILANYFIDSCGYSEKWKKSKEIRLKNFTYFKHTSIDSCTADEWRALQSIRGALVKDENFILEASEAGILSITMTHESENLICDLLNNLYNATETYYFKKELGSENIAFDRIRENRDSIERVINGLQSGIARFQDRNKGSMFRTDDVPLVKMQNDLMVLTGMRMQANSKYEMASFSLQNKQPYISSIDKPRLPLAPVFPARLKAVLTGFAIGLILSIVIIIARKLFLETMQ